MPTAYAGSVPGAGISGPAAAEPNARPIAQVSSDGRLCFRRALPAVRWPSPVLRRTSFEAVRWPSTNARQTSFRSDHPWPDQDAARAVSPAEAFLASGVLPGWGQRRLGQRRWLAFVALELASWGYLWDRRRTGSEVRGRYRDLAWFVARRGTPGERMDAGFEYYESLTKFNSSGAFDSDLFRGGIQPETDPETFNGSIWGLAAEIFLVMDDDRIPGPGSSEYQQAIEYYRERTVTPDFRWDWGEDVENRMEYTSLIQQSDEALRRSTTLVGVILANHLLAAFDAFITARLRSAAADASLDLYAFSDGVGQWWLAGQVSP